MTEKELTAKPVCTAAPSDVNDWVHWAYALRELQRVEEARDVLLKAEPLNADKEPVIRYNLACYYSLRDRGLRAVSNSGRCPTKVSRFLRE